MTMNLKSILGISIFLVICFFRALSGEVMADNDGQVEAEKLLRQAEELTDIRATGSHAFRLVARVNVSGEKTQQTEGTYSLVWKGPTDWQDKLQLGDFSQERTAVDNKLFINRSTTSFTLEVYHLLKLLEFPDLLRFSSDAKGQKLREKIKDGSREREIELALPGRPAWKTISFSESSPTPTLVEYKGSHFGYRFDSYAAFSGHQFPRLLAEFDSNKRLIQVQVQELAETTIGEATISDSTIAPSAEAHWYLWCPHPISMSSLDQGKVFPIPWPLRQGALERPVAIYGVVGTDGKWHNLTVVKSGGKEVDEYWLDVMRQQRFSPARCQEIPVLNELVREFGH
jgi:hypothetical protein